MSTSSNFTTKEWHGKEIFCWYREEAKKQKARTQTFIEIEKGRITISELLWDKKKPLVCAVFSAPYREETIESSHMSEAFIIQKGKMVGSADSMQGTLSYLVQLMSQEFKKNYNQVYLLPPSGTFFYRLNNFPPMPEDEMKSALKNEAQLFLESKLKDEPAVVKDWHVGSLERKETKNENYLFVGIPKVSIINYIEMLRDTKLDVAGFTTPQLLYFYYFNQQPEYKKSFIFVELTDYSLRISFFQNGVLSFIRYIGISKWSDESRFVRTVSSQIHHSILYLNQQYPDASLDRFILFNRTSIPHIVEEVARELEFNIENFDVTALANYSPELLQKMQEHHISLVSSLYAITMNLKSEAISLPLKDFDTRVQNKIRFQAAVVFFIFWIIALGVGFVLLKNIVDTQEKAIQALGDQSKAEQKLMQEREEIKKKRDLFSSRHEVLEKFINLKTRWLSLCYGIFACKLQDIRFTKITLSRFLGEGREVADKSEDELMSLPLQLELELKIFQPYANALQTFESFKAKLRTYYDIVKERVDSVVAKEGISFYLAIQLKKKEGQQ